MGSVVDEFWKVGSEHLHIRVHGAPQGRPTVVWPGSIGTAWDHEILCRELSHDRRIYAISPPGCGLSDWLRAKGDYAFVGLLSSALALVERIGADSIDWIGTSRGGAVGIALAESVGCIHKLVLNDIGPVAPLPFLAGIVKLLQKRTRLDSIAEAADETERRFGTRCSVRASVAQWHALASAQWRRTDDGGLTEHYDPALPAHLTQMGRWADQTATLLKASCQVLLLRGSLSPVVSAAQLRQLSAQKPSIEAVTLQGFGHAAFLDEPSHRAAIAGFLKDDR